MLRIVFALISSHQLSNRLIEVVFVMQFELFKFTMPVFVPNPNVSEMYFFLTPFNPGPLLALPDSQQVKTNAEK